MEPTADNVDIEEQMRERKRIELDQLSLELLSNTTYYKKYLAKTNPETKTRKLLEMGRFNKHKAKVMGLFCELLDNYEELGTTSIIGNTNIQHLFKECVEKTMQFIEWRDCMEVGDADTLFDHVEESELVPSQIKSSSESTSFWGKPIHKSNAFRRPTYK